MEAVPSTRLLIGQLQKAIEGLLNRLDDLSAVLSEDSSKPFFPVLACDGTRTK